MRVVPEDDPRDPKLSVYGDAEHARAYATRWDSGRGRARDARKQRALEASFEHLGAFGSVLDAPCGTGRMTKFLGTRGTYIGIDLAPAMLREARARHADARYVVGDLTRLPLADRSVDVAVCIRLMHLVRDPVLRVSFLRELARVSRVGVVVDFRHDRALRTWFGRVRARLGLRARAHNAHARETVAAELAQAGLVDPRFVAVRTPAALSDKMVVVARRAGPSAR
ncbi:MAG: class I SAM-dependent methyltransferase [Planctomycetota bacterium]|nr:class I SAM-dependent methyltransferase [Planctomycetota bacterium]